MEVPPNGGFIRKNPIKMYISKWMMTEGTPHLRLNRHVRNRLDMIGPYGLKWSLDVPLGGQI